MPDIFANFQSGVLSADPGTAGTVLASANFAYLPVVAAPDTLRLTLDPDGTTGVPEIVVVTAHSAFSTSVTAVRGQESAYGAGPARAHATDTLWRHGLTRQSIVNMMIPAATITATVAATPDAGFVFIDGSTIANAQVIYPATWARIPATWKAAPDMVLPDWRGRTLFMDDAATLFTLGGVGGANTHTIVQAELPAATITIDPPALTIDPPITPITINPPSTAVTGSTDTENVQHAHGIAPISRTLVGAQSDLSAAAVQVPSWEMDVRTDTESTQHTHPAGTLAVDIAAFNVNVDIAPFNVDSAPFQSGPLGSGVAIDTRPAHATVMFQLKVH